uniref:Histone H2B n=1 Tax=Oryza punctata TaxID=4537 RepID=A0A0E0LWA3_ORYPU
MVPIAKTDSVAGLISMASPQFDNDQLQTNFLEGPDSVPISLSQTDARHTDETDSVEGLHQEEHTDTPRESSFYDKRVDENLKILEEQSTEYHVLSPPCDGSSLRPDYLASTICEAPNMLSTPQEYLLGDEQQSSECHVLSPPCDGSSPQPDYLANTICEAPKMLSTPHDNMLGDEQQNSECHVLSPPCDESSLQPNYLVSTICEAPKMLSMPQEKCCEAQSEANDVYVRNDMNESVTPERISTESAEELLRSHDGTECKIFSFDIAMKIDSDSCETVSDKQALAMQPSAQHLLHSFRCGEITSKKSDAQSNNSHQGRSVADVIQIEGSSSFERTEINCQPDHALYSLCSTMSRSMDCQSDSLDKMENRADMSGKSQHAVHHLDRLGSSECISLDLERRIDTSNLKSSMSYKVHTSVDSSSQRTMSSLADIIHCNSLRMKSLSSSSSSLSGNVTTVPQDSSPSCSDILSDGDGEYTRKTNNCSVHPGVDVKYVTLDDQILNHTDYVLSGCAVLNPKNHPSITLPSAFPSYASSDQQSQQAYASNCSNKELGEKCIHGDPKGQPVSDGGILLQNSDNCADFDEAVELHQSCGIPIPANSPTIKERVLEAYRDSTKWVNLSTNLSSKCKINSKIASPLRSKYESLTARFEKLLGPASLVEVEPKWHYPSCDSKRMGVSGNKEDSEIPLTPSLGKYSLEKPSGARYTSKCTGSIPDLACFRIDEDSSTSEASRKHMDVRRLDLPTTKASSREPNHQAHLIIDPAMKKSKENRAPSIRKEVKVTQSLHDREIKGRILGNQTERHKSEANLHKGWKPSNIVTSMTSFIPLVKQKQRPTTVCVKRDVRVKALEMAEAVKRREQKKQNEREMRKAADELERERVKQEREQKQKHMEQKKKTDAYIVSRKRQWEDDGRKEKEKKKKCNGEPHKQRKQLGQRMHTGNSGKDASQKDPDDTEIRKNTVGVMINQLLSDEKTDSFPIVVTSGSNNVKAVVTDGKSGSSGHQIHGSLSDDADKPYEMSPYKDSDEEDGGNLEHKEEVRRRQKPIPPWTRKEILDEILLSNRTLDPREIFECKCSFRLSNVLATPIPQRRLN